MVCVCFLFAHGCYVTSMSVEGNRMVLDLSLTHSILINVFIKTGLSFKRGTRKANFLSDNMEFI